MGCDMLDNQELLAFMPYTAYTAHTNINFITGNYLVLISLTLPVVFL